MNPFWALAVIPIALPILWHTTKDETPDRTFAVIGYVAIAVAIWNIVTGIPS